MIIVSTGAMLLLVAFIVLQITRGSRFLPNFQDDHNYLLIYTGMSIIPPGFLVHRPTGFHLLSSRVRQCYIRSIDGVLTGDGDADDDVGSV